MITNKTLSTSQLLEPMTYKEAMSSIKEQEWENAIAKEYKSLIQNGTWELIYFPKGKNRIGCKWVCKHSNDIQNSRIFRRCSKRSSFKYF
jgi:hypothetical protein